MRLLLDTHTLLWWDNDELPSAVSGKIQRAEQVFVSAASIWEIIIKRALGKIRGTGKVDALLSDYGFTGLSITVAHAQAVGELPPLHRDPFDRLLIAQALSEDLVLVTSDKAITRYAVPVAWS